MRISTAAWEVDRSLETGSVGIAGDVTVAHDDLCAGARPTLTAEQAATVDILLDARAPERFRGAEHRSVD